MRSGRPKLTYCKRGHDLANPNSRTEHGRCLICYEASAEKRRLQRVNAHGICTNVFCRNPRCKARRAEKRHPPQPQTKIYNPAWPDLYETY